MRVKSILSLIVASLVTGKKITTLTNSHTGEQYTYTNGDQIYDYKNQSYWRIIRERTNTTIVDYKTDYYYSIIPKSPGIYTAYRQGSDELYHITVNNKLVMVMNQKDNSSSIFYF